MYSSGKNIRTFMTSFNHENVLFWKLYCRNLDKCPFMSIGAKDELQTDIESKKVAIENSKEEEVLGVTFDNKLEFYSYLTSINKKANIKLNNLTRVQKYMAPELKTVLTFSFIKS